MKSSILAVAAAAAAAPAMASLDTWSPAGEGEVRGPCPMLNTLTNHGFLPHSGKDFTLGDITDALQSALNIDAELSGFLFEAAVATNPAPNATTFPLSDLGRHGILEHDGSLSRKDFFFGDPRPFDAETYAETTSYWTADPVTLQMAADARMGRLATSLATNPDFTLTEVGNGFDAGESAAYIVVFGSDGESAPRNFLDYFFQNERLPTELGWKASESVLDSDGLSDAISRIRLKTWDNITAPNPDARPQDTSASTKRSAIGGPSVRRSKPVFSGRLRMH